MEVLAAAGEARSEEDQLKVREKRVIGGSSQGEMCGPEDGRREEPRAAGHQQVPAPPFSLQRQLMRK